MSYHIQRDSTYKLYGGVAISHNSVAVAYAMPNPHTHSDYELFFLFDGGRKFFLSNKIYSLLAPSALLIPPDEPHQTTINLKKHMERYAIYISPKLMANILRENPSLKSFLKTQIFNISDDSFEILSVLIKKIETQLALRDSFSPCHIKNAITEIIILLLRQQNETIHTSNTYSSFQKNDIRLQTPINFILEHYHEQISLEQCAKIANLSISHFSRQFHMVTGMSFKEYLIRVRVEKACELLKSPENIGITEIAIKCGFSDSSYFTLCFKSKTGFTPTKYRKAFCPVKN